MKKTLTPEQKQAIYLYWNNLIAMHYGGEEALRKRMFRRLALRTIRR